MKKIFFPLCLFLFVAGCWSYDENLVVHRDGSATLTIQLRVARQIRQQVNLDEFFDRDNIQKLLPPGSEIQRLDMDTERVLNFLILQVHIPDLNSAVGSFGSEQNLFGEITFSRDEKGNYVYQRSLREIGMKIRESLARQNLSPQRSKAISAIINRSFFKYRLETPLSVLKSNANKIEGKVLTWNVPVSKLTTPDGYVLTAVFRSPPSIVLIGILAALLLILFGGGGWYIFRHFRRSKSKPPQTEYVTTYSGNGEKA